ncbi:MAG: chemotaxis response regulator protein-glutamate methylesterase [Cellvibrionales bacterium]|nr:MAG: chemotaxis response regulator protein-glutamate methylesterase [Cellvibrionales bacterium]
MKLRLLVVDDSAMYRQALKGIVETIPGIQCVGVACDGKEALEKIISEKPDVVTLDMEMPVMCGMDVIKAVMAKKINTKLIIVSACSQSGAKVAINALRLGAYDFITKPDRLGCGGAKEDIRRQLVQKLEVMGVAFKEPLTKTLKIKDNPTIRQGNQESGSTAVSVGKPVLTKVSTPAPSSIYDRALLPKAIVMGSSTGGPNALLKLFSGLQIPLEIPIFIVQHMPPMFTQTLAKSIDEISAVSVKEAEDGEKPLPNFAYIAPGGRQMKLVQGSAGLEIKITDDKSDNFCKPSVDYFFSSAAELYESRVLGVILSGMGSDGCEGLRVMKNHGVTVFGQSEESCVVYGMPKVAYEAGLVDKQLSIDQMASAIESVLKISASRQETHAGLQ